MAIFTLSGLSQLIKHRVSFPVLFMVMLVFIVAIYFGYHNRNKVCSNMVFMFKVIFFVLIKHEKSIFMICSEDLTN